MEKVGEHAIVLGASVAGLLSARVLADAYHQVTIVERDPLPIGPMDRKGVPQGRHVHSLLPMGVTTIGELFPGLLDKFAADGVPVMHNQSQMWMCLNGHVLAHSGKPDDPGYQPSRPYLEARMRDEVRGMPNVVTRDDCTAIGLITSDRGKRVAGVRVAPREGDEETITADLVVDATGRGGRTPVWLRELGYDAPEEEELAIDIMYSSRRLRLPPGALGDLLAVIISPVPDRPSAMGLFAQENDHFMLTLAGYAGHPTPADHDGFLAFAESIAPEEIFAALRDAEWLDDARRHRFPTSRWRHYERLARFPDGLLVVGDGICSFNPLFGQGITIAALEAVALRDALTAGQSDLAKRFFAAAARPVGQAWQLAVSMDRTNLGLPQRASARAIGAYVLRLQAAAEHDPVLANKFLKVSGLNSSPATLLRPTVLLRVLIGNLRRRTS
jgi:2-polyprenyl-6-methoxyphenol hydroxylase-like FAD-dependent oxidoreductase